MKFKSWEIEDFDFIPNKWQKISTSEADIQCLHNLKANTKYKIRGRMLLMNDTWSDYSPDYEFRTLIGTIGRGVGRDEEKTRRDK